MKNLEKKDIGSVVAEKVHPPISRYTLALYCGASGDHNPIHVDIDFAKKAGMPDVFAHGMLIMAYLGQLLTGLAPIERHRKFSSRFQAITNLGDSIYCSALLKEIVEEEGEQRAVLEMVAKDQTGEIKITGEAVVAL